MRIFLTGATGFIGSTLLPELQDAGHQIIGVTRSDIGAQTLHAAGVEVFRGSLEDPEGLREGASKADAVIHTAFDHDFSQFVANCEKDARVIAALGAALKGSQRPLLVTSGTGVGAAGDGQPAREDIINLDHPNPRIASEKAVGHLLDDGVNVSVMRLPQVHDPLKQGLITPFIANAREKGVVAYVGEGRNRWPACHVRDVAKLYRLAIEQAAPGARWHAVAEEGVTARDIAASVARGLGLSTTSLTLEAAATHFGWMAMFMALDMPASSALTRSRLDWQPLGPTLLADLDEGRFA